MNQGLRPGMVIQQEEGFYVIIELIDGQIHKTIKIEDYVAKNLMLYYEGEYRTIKEIIEFNCNLYLSKHEIIRR